MKQQLQRLLAEWDQDHLLKFWEELSPAAQKSLAEQIEGIDFEALRQIYLGRGLGPDWASVAEKAEPPPAIRLNGSNLVSDKDADAAGTKALRSGHVAAILVAGGQGTRLGFDYPKGMFPIGPVSNASLFQILVEKIQARAAQHGSTIPLYLMTSHATHDQTVDYFRGKNSFGLPEDDLFFFTQGQMPALDRKTGKVLLADKGRLFMSPDGHGGTLAALQKSGAFDDIQRRGIRQLFYFQVDNPLAQVCDPVLIGHHILAGSELSTQVVSKQNPTDKVGNVVSVDGQVQIIEYSDLPEQVAQRRNPDGTLKLWAGSIAVHVLEVDFIHRALGQMDRLPFHIAEKAVPHLAVSGEFVDPEQPNAFKLERFIFDLLPMARKAIVVEVDPSNGFAPLKNKSGEKTDSPESVRRQMVKLHRQWLLECGATVENGVEVEISPLFANDPQTLAARINAGRHFATPEYLA